jgi:hypothetical protein
MVIKSQRIKWTADVFRVGTLKKPTIRCEDNIKIDLNGNKGVNWNELAGFSECVNEYPLPYGDIKTNSTLTI